MRKGFDSNESFNEMKQSNSKKDLTRFLITLVIMLFVFYEVASLLLYTFGKKSNNNMYIYNALSSIVNSFGAKNQETVEDYTLKLAALGNIYTTLDTLNISQTKTGYDFTTGTENVKEILKNYDVVTASLNTPIASGKYTSSSTIYNAPTEILDTIKDLGISVLATANYHSFDKNETGVSDTIKNINNSSLKQVGLNDSGDTNKPIVFEKNNIKLGILSYTTKSNIKITNSKYTVNQLTQENIDKDIAYLKTQNVDYIMAYVCVPGDSTMADSEQKNDVEMLFNSGVNIVLGVGTSVVQQSEKDQITLKDSSQNNVFAIYSLGNFIGKLGTMQENTNVIADITFTKKVTKDKKGNVDDSKTTKTYATNQPIKLWTYEGSNSTKIYKLDDALKEYENGNLSITKTEYNDLKTESNRIDQIFQ